jgi:hypothetical protein
MGGLQRKSLKCAAVVTTSARRPNSFSLLISSISRQNASDDRPNVSLAKQFGSEIHGFADVAQASGDDTEHEDLDRRCQCVFAGSFSTQPVHRSRKNPIDSTDALAADLDLNFVKDRIDHEDADCLRELWLLAAEVVKRSRSHAGEY